VAGKSTLVVRLGRGFARVQFCLSLAIALLMPVVLLARGYRLTVLLPLLLLPLAWRHGRRLRDGKTPVALIALLGDTGKFLAFYALLLSAGLVL